MSWTTYTVYNFADDLHWPELGILLESIDYHEAARKASFLGSMCRHWENFWAFTGPPTNFRDFKHGSIEKVHRSSSHFIGHGPRTDGFPDVCMCEDSLMAAIHFERRFDDLMKYVINSQEHPIGKVKDFIYRVEFKIWGSCHYLVTAYFFLDWKYTPGYQLWHSWCFSSIYQFCYQYRHPRRIRCGTIPIGQTTPNS